MRFTLWLSALLILAALLAPLPLKRSGSAPSDGRGKSGEPARPVPEIGAALAAADDTLCRLLAPTELNREQIACCMIIRKLLLDRYDFNRNDSLEADEIRIIRRDAQRLVKRRVEALLLSLDRDGDGRLSRVERRQADDRCTCGRRSHAAATPTDRSAATDRAAERSLPGDIDRMATARSLPETLDERSLSEQDFDSVPSSLTIALIAHHLIMATYDDNDNQRLDAEESKRLKADGEWLCAAREKELFDFCDSDSDGRLTEQEWRNALLSCGQLRKLTPGGANPLDHIISTFYDADIIRNLPHESPPDPCSSEKPSEPSDEPPGKPTDGNNSAADSHDSTPTHTDAFGAGSDSGTATGGTRPPASAGEALLQYLLSEI